MLLPRLLIGLALEGLVPLPPTLVTSGVGGCSPSPRLLLRLLRLLQLLDDLDGSRAVRHGHVRS